MGTFSSDPSPRIMYNTERKTWKVHFDPVIKILYKLNFCLVEKKLKSLVVI